MYFGWGAWESGLTHCVRVYQDIKAGKPEDLAYGTGEKYAVSYMKKALPAMLTLYFFLYQF